MSRQIAPYNFAVDLLSSDDVPNDVKSMHRLLDLIIGADLSLDEMDKDVWLELMNPEDYWSRSSYVIYALVEHMEHVLAYSYDEETRVTTVVGTYFEEPRSVYRARKLMDSQ